MILSPAGILYGRVGHGMGFESQKSSGGHWNPGAKVQGCTTDRWSVLWKYLTWYKLQDKPFKSLTAMETPAVKMKKAKGRNTDSIGKNRINAPFHHPFGYKSHCKSHFPPRGLIVFTLNPRLQTGR